MTIVTFLTGAEGDASSWLNWSLSQAKTVSTDAGNALYKGVRELACLKVTSEKSFNEMTRKVLGNYFVI